MSQISDDNIEEVGNYVPSMQEPDKWVPFPFKWFNAPAHVELIKRTIERWNAAMGPAISNPYTRPEVQSFTIIKTLPPCEPWISLQEEYYWEKLAPFVPNLAILMSLDPKFDIANIDKNNVRWEVTVEEVTQRIQEVDQEGRKQGLIITKEQYDEEIMEKMEKCAKRREAKRKKVEFIKGWVKKARRTRRTKMIQRAWKAEMKKEWNSGSEIDDSTQDPDYVPESDGDGSSSDDSGYAHDSMKLN